MAWLWRERQREWRARQWRREAGREASREQQVDTEAVGTGMDFGWILDLRIPPARMNGYLIYFCYFRCIAVLQLCCVVALFAVSLFFCFAVFPRRVICLFRAREVSPVPYDGSCMIDGCVGAW